MIEEDEIGEEEKRQDIAEPTTPSPVRVSEGVKQQKSSKKLIGGGSKPGTYAAQCVECMKWRKVPNKEVFEEIRELAERDPFMCEKAHEWTEGSQVSCQDEPDLSPEGNERMWLMDKPYIPRPPNGWKRLVYLRKNPTGNKFADVYYVSPCGKRLRSGTELAEFFDSNVHYKEQGVSLSQFNFQTPMPLLQVLSEKSSKKKKKQHIGISCQLVKGPSILFCRTVLWQKLYAFDLKLGWRVVVATIIGFVGSACGTVGGVGGGGIFVPMLNLVVGFDTKSVAALSKCMIMGASASYIWYILRVKHPYRNAPMIDYDLALLFQPMLMMGITTGVTLSVIFPYWLITILIIILFIGTSYRSFFRGIEIWKKEKKLKQEESSRLPLLSSDEDYEPLHIRVEETGLLETIRPTSS